MTTDSPHRSFSSKLASSKLAASKLASSKLAPSNLIPAKLLHANFLPSIMKRLRMIPVGGAFRPLTPGQLTELERRIPALLPADYKTFLATSGRCGFDGKATVLGKRGEAFPLHLLFGAPEPGRTDDLFWHCDHLRDELPPGHLIIGEDEFGDPYVMQARSGRVYYRNFHSGDASLEPVSVGFMDFLGRVAVTASSEL